MIIKSMDASFGSLENAHMELEPGLNVIEAPNEAGKSTWCAFIRTMLYGINTSQREKNGVLPDKKRYLPWGSYSMGGSMEISWRGGEARLQRRGGAGKPMGACEAKISGTGEKLPELCGKAPGEVILGVPESVFRRSAFISSGAMAVDRDAELEKRIASLITSGSEEDEAYSSARDTLHGWQVKRRYNARVGRAAELEKCIAEKDEALGQIRDKNARMADIYAQREEETALAARLERELRLNDAAEQRRSIEKAGAARAAREAAENRLAQLRTAAEGVTAEKISAAREAVGAYKEAAAEKRASGEALERYNAAEAERQKAEKFCADAAREAAGVSAEGLATARRALYEYETALAVEKKARAERESFTPRGEETAGEKASPLPLAVGAVLLALGVLVCVLGLRLGTPLLLGGAVAGAAGVLLLIWQLVKRSTAGKEAEAARKAQETELSAFEKAEKAARESLEAAKGSLVSALAAIGGETIPERAAARIEERAALLERLERAKGASEAAARVAEGLAPARNAAELAERRLEQAAAALSESLAALNIDPTSRDISRQLGEKAELLESLNRAGTEYAAALKLEQSVGQVPEQIGTELDAEEPEMERDAAAAALAGTRVRLSELERQLAQAEGELSHLGDPLVLDTELGNLREELGSVDMEHAAISLAISVLDEANAELQQRFSPIVGSLAGRLMSAMTGGAYDGISFDREFSFSAYRANEPEHGAEYLSTGTAAQLYLAVRLAICMLALPEDEPCPIILDDALLGFDDERARAALSLLRELAGDRQIILFTCQSREKRLLEAM